MKLRDYCEVIQPMTTADAIGRLRAMIAPGQQTWDLSPNDVRAIRLVLESRDQWERLAAQAAFPKRVDADNK